MRQSPQKLSRSHSPWPQTLRFFVLQIASSPPSYMKRAARTFKTQRLSFHHPQVALADFSFDNTALLERHSACTLPFPRSSSPPPSSPQFFFEAHTFHPRTFPLAPASARNENLIHATHRFLAQLVYRTCGEEDKNAEVVLCHQLNSTLAPMCSQNDG